MRKLIGGCLVFSVFAGIFAAIAVENGVLAALATFGVGIGIAGLLLLGVFLLTSEE